MAGLVKSCRGSWGRLPPRPPGVCEKPLGAQGERVGTGLEWVPPPSRQVPLLLEEKPLPTEFGEGAAGGVPGSAPCHQRNGFSSENLQGGSGQAPPAALPGGWVSSWTRESICHEGKQFSDVLKGGPSRPPETLSGRTKLVPRCTGREATGHKLAGRPFFK